MKARSGWLGVVLASLLAAPVGAGARTGSTGPPAEGTPAQEEADGGTAQPRPPPERTSWFLGMRSDLSRIRFEANALRLRVGRLGSTAQAVMSQRLDELLSRDETLTQDLMLLEQLPRGAWLQQWEGFESQVDDLRAELDAFESTLTEWGA